jgi:hypothetical protein
MIYVGVATGTINLHLLVFYVGAKIEEIKEKMNKRSFSRTKYA